MTRGAIALSLALLTLGGCATTGGPGEPQSEQPQESGVHTDPRKAADANADLGLRYMIQGKYDLALEKFKRALSYDSRAQNANHYIAELYRRVGKMEDAQRHYERAVDSDSDVDPNPALRQNYGVFLCQQKRFEEAEKQFQKVLDNPVYTGRAQVLENLGLCFLEKPDYAKAEEFLRQALAMMPRSPSSLLGLAEVSFAQQNYVSARAFLQRYTAVAQHSPASAWLGVRVERALGDKNAEASYGLLLKNRFADSAEAREYLKSGNP